MAARYGDLATKTTFILSDSRRTRLKAVALARGTTVTDLLSEGTDLVLAKYERLGDRERLLAKARRARELLRNGLFEGPASSSQVDEVLYPRPSSGRAGRARHKARERSK